MITGRELGEQLAKALGLPKYTIGFTLRCYTNEAATVTCEYFPELGEKPVISEYTLVPKQAASEAPDPQAPA